MKRIITLLILGMIWIGFPGLSAAEILLSEPYPREEMPVTITITDDDGQPVPNALISFLYRPNSEVEHLDQDLGTTNLRGQYEWVPSNPGICTITAVHGETTLSKNIAIKFATFPVGGLLVFLGAGTLLFGGIIFSYKKLVSKS